MNEAGESKERERELRERELKERERQRAGLLRCDCREPAYIFSRWEWRRGDHLEHCSSIAEWAKNASEGEKWGSTVYARMDAAAMKDTDAVNPEHYKKHPSGVECIAITRHMGFNLGNVVKYLWRAGLKKADFNSVLGGDVDRMKHIEDLKKARWYLDDEIKKLEGEPGEN